MNKRPTLTLNSFKKNTEKDLNPKIVITPKEKSSATSKDGKLVAKDTVSSISAVNTTISVNTSNIAATANLNDNILEVIRVDDLNNKANSGLRSANIEAIVVNNAKDVKPENIVNDVKASNLKKNNSKDADGTTKKDKDESQVSRSIKLAVDDKEYDLVLRYLKKKYPKCFPIDLNDVRPLAIGIHKQLFNIPDLPFSRMQIRKFFRKYVTRAIYRSKMTIGQDRIDLDGLPVSKVLETEVREKLKKIEAEDAKP